MEGALQEKWERLTAYLAGLDSVAVAFSGGVDSTFLLRAAKEALGERAVAVTAVSASFPERERREAAAYCESEGIRQIFFTSEELAIDGFAANPRNRCYLCKRELFSKMLEIAAREGLAAVAEGSNMDDLGDYRPGLMAVAELGIASPLREAGFTKDEIRRLSRQLGLPTWKKPSFACLASRFVYGETITEEKLRMVERAEQLLLSCGFSQVRVRIHGTMARIEILPEEFPRLVSEEIRRKVADSLRDYGFSYVTMDLMGYRSGSMNEAFFTAPTAQAADSHGASGNEAARQEASARA